MDFGTSSSNKYFFVVIAIKTPTLAIDYSLSFSPKSTHTNNFFHLKLFNNYLKVRATDQAIKN